MRSRSSRRSQARERDADRVNASNIHVRDLSRSLPMALMRAREAVMQYFRPHHRKHGVTEQQWRVLRVLHKAGEIEIAELAQQSMLLAPSLSRILRDLGAAGLVQRRPVEHDLRRSLISIAPAGVAVLAKVAPLSETSYSLIAHRFGEERLDELFALLRELESSLCEPAGASEAATDGVTPQTKSRRMRLITHNAIATPKPGSANATKIS